MAKDASWYVVWARQKNEGTKDDKWYNYTKWTKAISTNKADKNADL